MIGQLITSFLQGKASPITTSTTFKAYVDRATVGNKTGYYNGSPGGLPATNSRRGKTVGVWGRLLRVANDLLPYKLRPIKARRYRIRGGYGVRAEIYWFKRTWHSHRKPRLVNAIKKLQLW